MPEPVKLSFEQQFSLRAFSDQVKTLDLPQSKELLVSLYGQMLAREAMYKHLLQHEWGINPPTLDNQQD